MLYDLAVHLRDIAHIEDTLPNFLDESDDLDKVERPVNLNKMHSLAMLIYMVQNLGKGMNRYPEIDIDIRDKLLTSITNSMDSEALYQASIVVQPISISPRINRSASDCALDIISLITEPPMDVERDAPRQPAPKFSPRDSKIGYRPRSSSDMDLVIPCPTFLSDDVNVVLPKFE